MRLQQVEIPAVQFLARALDHQRRVQAAAQQIPGLPGVPGRRHRDDAPGPELPWE